MYIGKLTVGASCTGDVSAPIDVSANAVLRNGETTIDCAWSYDDNADNLVHFATQLYRQSNNEHMEVQLHGSHIRNVTERLSFNTNEIIELTVTAVGRCNSIQSSPFTFAGIVFIAKSLMQACTY